MAEVPSVENLICVLQKCRKKKDLAYAKRVHVQICNNGLETHRIVGNYIVPTLVECGSLSDAQQVFDRLPHRNEHSWTSLILGYIQCGQSQHAFNLYKKMQEGNVCPSSFTLLPLLRVCAMLKDLESGQEFHFEISQNGFERDLVVCNTLVSMYAKCSSLSQAQEVFDKLPVRDAVSWNALIGGYVEHGSGKEVLKCFELMQLEGIFPDDVTFICVLKACGRMGEIDKGREVHMEITQKGFDKYPLVGNTLVDMYARCGSLFDAYKAFDKLPARDVVSWNALILGYVDHAPSDEVLKHFEQMQLEGVLPNVATFICLLKICCIMGDTDKGREIHVKISQNDFEGDLSVSSTLVSMYAKCGSLSEAQKVFETLPVRGVVLWTALIAGYAQHGPAQKALKIFEQMLLEGVSPDAVTFVYALKACGSIGALVKGQEIHTEIIKIGFDRDLYVSNSLVDMYAKSRSISEAQEVLAKLPVRDIVSWNAIIAGHAEYGLCHEAFRCLQWMQTEGISCNAVTFVCVLKACGSVESIDKRREIHQQIAQHEFEGDLSVGNSLVDMYAKCDRLLDAQDVFDKLPTQDVVSWNTLIVGYAEHGHTQEVLRCFEQMQLVDASPDAVTYVCLLQLCGSMGAIDKGREIHLEVTLKGIFVGSSLVGMYAKCGSLSEAQEVFANLPFRDAVTWTELAAGYAEHGLSIEVFKCFEQMQLEGLFPDAFTFDCVLKACGSAAAIDNGRKLHMEITQKGFESDSLVGNTLVDMYAKCGALSEACAVFERLSGQDVVSWNALLSRFSEHLPGLESLKCFEQMQLDGISPNFATFICLLKVCYSLGAIDMSRNIHIKCTQEGLEKNPSIGSSLVGMYSKFGLCQEAWKVFENLQAKDVVSWNALIAGYAINRQDSAALQFFNDMQKQGVKPNAVTFTSLLTACSHASLLFKGREYFGKMREEYGIIPTRDHCTGMVDLLARSGCLYEAEKFLEIMACPLSEGMLRALLNGCKMYGELELGERCFQQLVQMNPNDAASYVLMEDIYTNAGRWDEAYRIENLRKHLGAKKIPAKASIEMNKRVHEFMVGDNQSKDILAMLEVLRSRMKDNGHVSNLDLVLRPFLMRENAALC